MALVYVYGILEEPVSLRPGLSGVGGRPVYAVRASGLAAVLSSVDAAEIDPTRASIRTHLEVQNELMRQHTLLPMVFGAVAGGDDAVRAVLAKSRDRVLAELRRLSGKIEVGLTVSWNRAGILAELKARDSKFSKLWDEAGAAPREKAEFIMVEIGKRVEKASQEWRSRYGPPIYRVLQQMAADAALNPVTAPQNVLNASFLVDGAREDRFKVRVGELGEEHEGRLEFKYVAPLPPYSFVRIRLQGNGDDARDAGQAAL